MPYTTKYNLLAAAATTTTSAGFVVGDRNKLSLQYITSGSAVGTGHLRFEVSNDGTNFVAYNRLISNVAAGTAFTTLNFSGTESRNQMIFVPAGDHFAYIRAKLLYDNAQHLTVTVIASGVIAGQ